MKAIFDKEKHYYKYLTNNYDRGNAGGINNTTVKKWIFTTNGK